MLYNEKRFHLGIFYPVITLSLSTIVGILWRIKQMNQEEKKNDKKLCYSQP